MPASMISAPTGARPKVIGSSIATVAMVPMPGTTPTSVPTSAPIRHSRMFIGTGLVIPPRNGGAHCTNWKTVAKPRPRLEQRSPIAASLLAHQESRPHLQRQTQRIREQQGAERRQTGADNECLQPFGFRAAQGSNQEARHRGEDHAHRADAECERQNRKANEERAAPVKF